MWDSNRKLTLSDFSIKNSEDEMLSYGQYVIDSNIKGFDFLVKDFNKKVRNYFIKSASWINPNFQVEKSLRYQQTLFDLSEIYAREFRKNLKNRRREIIKGFGILEELNQKATTDFSKRRLQYDNDTKYGTIEEKQIEWEKQILKELNEYKEFAY